MPADCETPGQGSEAAPQKEIVPQIAEAWGTSRAYVYKLKKRGCPVHDVEAATKWREEHAARGVGYRSKNSADSSAGEEASLRKDREAPNAPKRQIAGARPTERVLASLYDSVEAAIEIESEAFRLVQLAQKQQQDSVIAIRIAAYTKAQQGRFEAEERYRKEMERQRILVPLEEAKKVGRRAYDIMIPLMRAMGKNLGPRVSPSDPLAGMKMIDAEIEAIIKAGRGEYEAPSELPPVKIELEEEAEDGIAS